MSKTSELKAWADVEQSNGDALYSHDLDGDAHHAKAALLRNVAELVEAASCIIHWHDVHDGGMIVSGEKVRELWKVLAKLEQSP